jgi:hypothetical protein
MRATSAGSNDLCMERRIRPQGKQEEEKAC